jgi:hypothetical protein
VIIGSNNTVNGSDNIIIGSQDNFNGNNSWVLASHFNETNPEEVLIDIYVVELTQA